MSCCSGRVNHFLPWEARVRAKVLGVRVWDKRRVGEGPLCLARSFRQPLYRDHVEKVVELLYPPQSVLCLLRRPGRKYCCRAAYPKRSNTPSASAQPAGWFCCCDALAGVWLVFICRGVDVLLRSHFHTAQTSAKLFISSHQLDYRSSHVFFPFLSPY